MNVPIIPGRGLVTNASTNMRLDFLKTKNIETNLISDAKLNLDDIKNNIESYIGSTEIPLGIVGPMVFNDQNQQELVYCPAGTLEGALVASMNRGAKVISKSNGFSAHVKWQKMTRSPMFIFESDTEALIFKNFINNTLATIKKAAEKFSNHAKLLSINIVHLNHVVHLKFEYQTGDASGQNMTTTCTWHAMLFIVEQFKHKTGIIPVDFVIEGNGACDKKVSQYNINSGRGIHVVAECSIPEHIIRDVLRTTSDKLISCFYPSKKLAQQDGMIGYNINVANTIAAIFVATGQDLASIHESSVGVLHLEKRDNHLYIQLTLPNLVIGSVGGGTSLPKQSQALEIMKCYGSGKVKRFAKLIAGFALGLEISTYAAIVSGEFAKAHEKLGRNKPVNWLLKSEITPEFIKKNLNNNVNKHKISQITFNGNKILENGILTNIASKVNKKIVGFIPFQIDYKLNGTTTSSRNALIKSKPLDDDVMKGLHIVAASINPELSDLLKQSKKHLEYNKCHFKEIALYEYLSKNSFTNFPTFYGKHINTQREIYLLMQEFLDASQMKIMNSENRVKLWEPEDICAVIRSITKFHQTVSDSDIECIKEFKPWVSINLYKKLMDILITERASNQNVVALKKLRKEMCNFENEANEIELTKTIIHNDFNSRNIAIRSNGEPIIYDWELATIDFPHRDIIEFLSFVLPENFKKETLFYYLKEHYGLYPSASWNTFLKAYTYSLKVYIVTRLSFYEVSGILMAYDFSKRVLNVALRMLKMLEEND